MHGSAEKKKEKFNKKKKRISSPLGEQGRQAKDGMGRKPPF